MLRRCSASFARSLGDAHLASPLARRLTRLPRYETSLFHLPNHMGQQLNKYIKRKRRAAYLKRKKAKAKLTTASKKK
jgi:hypothetical protein